MSSGDFEISLGEDHMAELMRELAEYDLDEIMNELYAGVCTLTDEQCSGSLSH